MTCGCPEGFPQEGTLLWSAPAWRGTPFGAGSLLFVLPSLPLLPRAPPLSHLPCALSSSTGFLVLPSLPSQLPHPVILACPFSLFCPPGFGFRILLLVHISEPPLPLHLAASWPASSPPPSPAHGLPWAPCLLSQYSRFSRPQEPPPLGEVPAQAPPLPLPLPCSPLIEMLMSLLSLPSLSGGRAPWPGRCTCQVRGRRGLAARFNWKGTGPSPATAWEWGAGGGRTSWSPAVPGARAGGWRRGPRVAGERQGRKRKRGRIRESLAQGEEAGKEEESQERDPGRRRRQTEGVWGRSRDQRKRLLWRQKGRCWDGNQEVGGLIREAEERPLQGSPAPGLRQGS